MRAIAMGLAFALMWASAFTSARIIVQSAPPLSVSAVRFVIAGTLVLALARFMGQSLRLTPGQVRLTVVFGLCQNALYLGLNFVAMQWVEASLAAVVASSLPLWVALAGLVLAGERLPPLGIAGLAAGMAGVLVITGARIEAGVSLPGLALCLLAVLALTAATLAVRGASSGGNIVAVVGWQMLVGALALAPAALLFETWAVDWSPLVLGAFFYTVFVPGILATLTWFALVNRVGATRAATFHFLTPFFGVAIAAALLGERIGRLDIAGVAVIAAGILAVQLSRISRSDRAPLRSGPGRAAGGRG